MADEGRKGGDAKGEGKADAKGAPGGEAGKGPEDAAKSGKMKRMIVIAVIVVVDLVAMAGVAWFVVQKLKSEDPTQVETRRLAEEEARKREMVTSMGVALEKPITMTVNLAEPGDPRYLKVGIQLEWDAVTHPELGAALTARMPKINDRIILILSSQTMEKLLRPDGKEFIKESIVKDVNAMLPEKEGRIRSAYFTEFLLQ